MQAMSSTLRDVAKQTTILIFDGIKYASMIFYLYLNPLPSAYSIPQLRLFEATPSSGMSMQMVRRIE